MIRSHNMFSTHTGGSVQSIIADIRSHDSACSQGSGQLDDKQDRNATSQDEQTVPWSDIGSSKSPDGRSQRLYKGPLFIGQAVGKEEGPGFQASSGNFQVLRKAARIKVIFCLKNVYTQTN